MKRQALLSILVLIAITVATAQVAFAAQVTSATTKPSPADLTIAQGSSGTFDVVLVISGAVPQKGDVYVSGVCQNLTLDAQGAFSCPNFYTVKLNAGQNYTVKGHNTTLTYTVTITVPANVPCGATYNGALTLSVPAGSGVDFGNVLSVTVPYSVFVSCPATNDQGCSLGYWKTHPQSWPTSPVNYPGLVVSDLFTLPGFALALADDSLLASLNYDGGSGNVDAAKLLIREGVAGTLNAAHTGVAYPKTVDQVKTMVNNALATGDRATMLAAKDALSLLNAGPEDGPAPFCPLN